MIRKDFLKTCGTICLSSSALALLLQSCGSAHYAVHTFENNIITLSQSEFTEIKKDKVVKRSFVIVKNAVLPFPICVYKNGDQPNALLMRCTHQGCEVNPNAYSLVCPCHGSEYDTTGKVINPPAERPLTAYIVTTDADNYYIHLKAS